MTKEEIEKEYYEWAIRGDFQNETDLIDIDKAWDYFSEKLDQETKSLREELERVRNMATIRKMYQANDKIQSLSARVRDLEEYGRKVVEAYNKKSVSAYNVLCDFEHLLTPPQGDQK